MNVSIAEKCGLMKLPVCLISKLCYFISLSKTSLWQCFLNDDPQSIIFLHCSCRFNLTVLFPVGLPTASHSINIPCDSFRVTYNIWCFPSLFHFVCLSTCVFFFFPLMEYQLWDTVWEVILLTFSRVSSHLLLQQSWETERVQLSPFG